VRRVRQTSLRSPDICFCTSLPFFYETGLGQVVTSLNIVHLLAADIDGPCRLVPSLSSSTGHFNFTRNQRCRYKVRHFGTCCGGDSFNPLKPEFYIYILAHPVCKMWIIQKPKKVALWNKRHFEEKNRRVGSMFKILITYICWKKYIKCNIWRVTVRPSYI